MELRALDLIRRHELLCRHSTVILLWILWIDRRKPKILADPVALVRLEKFVHSSHPEIAFPEVGAICGVDLRVGIEITHTLDITDQHGMVRGLVGEVREGLRCVAV